MKDVQIVKYTPPIESSTPLPFTPEQPTATGKFMGIQCKACGSKTEMDPRRANKTNVCPVCKDGSQIRIWVEWT